MTLVEAAPSDDMRVILCLKFDRRAASDEVMKFRQRLIDCPCVFHSVEATGAFDFMVEAGLAEPAMRMRRLYVRPAFRRTGLATRLAGAMMQQGFQAAPLLTVNAGASEAAAPFWAAMGFAAVDWPGVTHALRL